MGKALRRGLEAEGFAVDVVRDGTAGLGAARFGGYDAVILDIMLPGLSGYAVLRTLREEGNWVPVLMLSAKDGEYDLADALDYGADDYLTKPFSTVELLARLRVALRHVQPATSDPVFIYGDVQIDLARRLVTRKGEAVKLTPTEYALIRLLVQHAGKVLTHRQILKEVWGAQYVDETHYLRVYFGQLRQKLEENPAMPRLIVTEPGVGYRLVGE